MDISVPVQHLNTAQKANLLRLLHEAFPGGYVPAMHVAHFSDFNYLVIRKSYNPPRIRYLHRPGTGASEHTPEI